MAIYFLSQSVSSKSDIVRKKMKKKIFKPAVSYVFMHDLNQILEWSYL